MVSDTDGVASCLATGWPESRLATLLVLNSISITALSSYRQPFFPYCLLPVSSAKFKNTLADFLTAGQPGCELSGGVLAELPGRIPDAPVIWLGGPVFGELIVTGAA